MGKIDVKSVHLKRHWDFNQIRFDISHLTVNDKLVYQDPTNPNFLIFIKRMSDGSLIKSTIHVNNKIDLLLFDEKHEDALNLAEEKLKEDPNNTELKFQQARALLCCNQREKALGVYEEILDLIETEMKQKSDNAYLKHQKAWALWCCGRQEEALAVQKDIVKQNPECSVAWNNMAVTLFILKEYEQALSSMNKAISIDPDCILYLRTKYDLLIDMGKTDEAYEVLENVLSANPVTLENKIEKAMFMEDTGFESAKDLRNYRSQALQKPYSGDNDSFYSPSLN